METPEEKSDEKPDAMDIDTPSGAESTKNDKPQPSTGQTSSAAAATSSTSISTDVQIPSGEVSQTTLASTPTGPVTEHVSPVAAAPAFPPADPQAPQAQDPLGNAAPLHATPPNIPGSSNQGVNQPHQQQHGSQGDQILQQSAQSQEPTPTAVQSEIPSGPPVIEHTGRNLTILENFDDRTAHSKRFSMYFNAKKPPRLTSTCAAQPSTSQSSPTLPPPYLSCPLIKTKHN